MHTGVVLDEGMRVFIGSVMPSLNERQRRLFLAKLSECLGYGSAKEISDLTGVSQKTISCAKKEVLSNLVRVRAFTVAESQYSAMIRQCSGAGIPMRILPAGAMC